jgi:hypothetical protein
VKSTVNSSGYVTNGGTVSVNTPTLVDGDTYHWSVHTSDQYLPSPETAVCAFVVDQKAPLNPSFASTDYPSVASGQTGAVRAGGTGTITLTSSDQAPAAGAASGLRGFSYSWDTPVPSSGASFVAASGGSASLSFSTSTWGVHTLYAQATDLAGNNSAQNAYSFYVPWNPGAQVTAGDVDGDHVPDLIATDSGGNLVEYAGDSSPGTAPVQLSTPGTSPDGASSWSAYRITHSGSFTNGPVDDLWAFDTSTGHLYLAKNSGGTGGNFADRSKAVDITKAEIVTDEYNDSTAGASDPNNACFTTTTGSCAAYDNTDWSGLTQVVAPGDLYAGDPVAGIDNGSPGLLTVENGALYYYQGQSMQSYLGTAIQLGTGGWDGVTVLGPGKVGGATVLWARDASGTLRQYPITFDSAGYPVNLGTPTGGSGTVVGVPAGNAPDGTQLSVVPAAQYPTLYTADLHGTGQPDLIAATASGVVIDWPGTAPSSGIATLASPKALGDIGPHSGEIDFAEAQVIYPDGSTWSNAKTTATMVEGVLTLTDTATGALLKSFGTGPHPNGFLILQTDGNLVTYDQVVTETAATWSTGTFGSGEKLELQTTGNLVLVSSTGAMLWQSGTGH